MLEQACKDVTEACTEAELKFDEVTRCCHGDRSPHGDALCHFVYYSSLVVVACTLVVTGAAAGRRYEAAAS